MDIIWAEQALTAQGWLKDAALSIDGDGKIARVEGGVAARGYRTGILLPAPSNLHSHAFQRAMAGMTERRGPDPRDTFWTWRKLMFRFLDALTPEDVEAIAAFVQMEMLEAGYAASVEFHYLHHQPGGTPYANPAEMASRIAAAAAQTGIGLTLLPVLYQHGGCDGRLLGPGQIRFGNSIESYARLLEMSGKEIASLPGDTVLGVAPHSLRAVTREDLTIAATLLPRAPIHMHVAEQTAEIDEVMDAWGERPMAWLLANHKVNSRWCLIHSTHMQPHETSALAKSGAVAGLCPITESSLGDGIFDGKAFLEQSGRFGIGSDSNIRIALSEELRTLEYSQRLRDRSRAVLATQALSTGRVLYEGAALGGAQAAGRNAGKIAPGYLADLVGLDSLAIDLSGRLGDEVLDSFIFAGDDTMVRDVWSAGRHLVRQGRHHAHETISARYRSTLAALGRDI